MKAPLTYEELLRWLERSDADPSDRRVGLEWEKEGVRSDGRRIPFAGEEGVEVLLEGMAETGGWTRSQEGGALVGLKRDGASVTLEPGAQVELSSSPCRRISGLEIQARSHLRELQSQTFDWDCRFLMTAYSPVQPIDDITFVPKARYGFMAPFLSQTGVLAHGMMKGTSSVQVTLDYVGGAEGGRMMAIGLGLCPLVAALSASSPLADGQLQGCASYRARCWRATDPARTGLLATALRSKTGLSWYLDWLLDTPMIFRQGASGLIAAQGTFRQWMDQGIDGVLPGPDDFFLHTSQVFPELRLKGFLEFRCMDNGPLDQVLGLAALWKGIFYDDAALDAAEDLVRDLGFSKRERLWRLGTEEGLGALWRRRTLGAWLADVLEIAESGLQNQAPDGPGEVCYLAALEERVHSGRSYSAKVAELWAQRGSVAEFLDAVAYPPVDTIPPLAPEAMGA